MQAMDALPYDIVSSIFSHLSQSDCLQCMRVSRWWASTTPHYATHVWRNLEFTNSSNFNHRHMLQCLGPHVKKVVFRGISGERLTQTMAILVKQGCTGVQELEFARCGITHDATFIRALQQVAHHSITALAFEGHRSINVDLQDVISACPNLQQLSYATDGSWRSSRCGMPALPTANLAAPRRSGYSCKIKRLHLHGRFAESSSDVLDVLKRCPQLQQVVLCCDLRNCDQQGALELEAVRQLCPRLVSVECNLDCNGGYLHSWQPAESSTDDGLQRFVALEQKGYGAEQMEQAVSRCGQTIQVLSLRRDERLCGMQGEWTNLLDLGAPWLRVLSLDNINIKGRTVAALLRQTPRLQEFLWVTARADRMTDTVAVAIQGLTQLCCLHIGCSEDGKRIAGTEGFEQLLDGCSLEVLGMMGRGLVTDRMLSRVATIRTLRKLGLWHTQGDELSDQGMAHFASTLKTTALEHLQLADMSAVSDTVFAQLVRRQQRLAHVGLAGCNSLTDTGLAQLQEAAPSSLHSVSIQDCALITERSMAAFTSRLGKDMVIYHRSKHG